MKDVIIIGAGTAGLTAAIYALRAGKSVLVLEQSSYGGQIINTPHVENYPGIERISGYEFASGLFRQAEKLGMEYRNEKVTDIREEENREAAGGKSGKIVETTERNYRAKAVILATGAKNRPLGIEKEAEFIGRGISYCATCDGAFFRGKTVAVVGGGDVALEDAIYLSRLCEKVYLIHRRDELRGAYVLQKELKEMPNVEFLYSHVVEEITGEDTVNGLRIKNLKEQESHMLPVDGVFVAVGIRPGTELVRDLVACDEGGYVLAGEDCAASVPGIFAAGDVRKKPLRQIATAVADGANAATSAENYL